MGRTWIILACACTATLLAGCRETASVGSLKDDARKSAVSTMEQPKPDLSVVDRAKAEQSAHCGQRHIDYGKGRLNESEDQKRTADAVCAELHRYDYMR
jgi:hypothetical protein